jgi:hypothetical protein
LRQAAGNRQAEVKPMTCAFISDHKIDSYLKLQIMLLLHRRGQRSISLDELADQIFVADMHGLERLICELCAVGLLCDEARRWRLADRPEVAYCLRCLECTFDDPLARQQLLKQISSAASPHVS